MIYGQGWLGLVAKILLTKILPTIFSRQRRGMIKRYDACVCGATAAAASDADAKS